MKTVKKMTHLMRKSKNWLILLSDSKNEARMFREQVEFENSSSAVRRDRA